jgi:CheY-like chemotaxis protein/HPt (histidine-containing phosphotransfer) domain-containing protein
LEKEVDDVFWINFQVYDTGIGISDENLEKIFESFKQASAGIHGEYGGTGLGLSIVKQLVELQGGRISVSSEVNKGTMFEVVLPFKDSGKKIMRAGEEFNYDNGIQTRIQELDILIAEDNPINQKLITSIFMQWGANFDLVSNGQEAIDHSRIKKYDLIFMDINMPVMNGYEAVVELKKDKKNLNSITPIITLTAAALQEERKRMFKAGVFDFITKPFSPKQLQQTIVNCLDKNTKPGDVMIDKNEVSKIEIENQLYDLSHLEKFSQHNPDFVREMIDMFLNQNPLDLAKLDSFLEEKNWDQVKDIAHQMKSIYGTLGMLEQQHISKDIEHNVRDGNVNLQHYLDWSKQLRKGTEQVYPLLVLELKGR